MVGTAAPISIDLLSALSEISIFTAAAHELPANSLKVNAPNFRISLYNSM